MRWIKLAFQRIWQIWYFIAFYGVYLLIFPIYFILLIRPTRKSLAITHIVSRFWSKSLFVLGLQFWKVKRNYTLDPKGTYIFIANHRSFLDIPLGQITIPYFVRYIGKAEAAKLPFFGYMYRRVHILVDRKNREDRAKSLQRVTEELKNGYSIFFYPEGTSKTPYNHKLGELKDGAFLAALQLGIPIIPITIINSNAGLSNDGKFRVTPLVTFQTILDPPLKMDDLSISDIEILKQRARDNIDSNLQKYYGS